VQHVEVRDLPEVGALAADLEGEPLVAEVRFDEGRVAEEVCDVVLCDEVVQDCAGFPEAEAGVGVVDCWVEMVSHLRVCYEWWGNYRGRGR
jgi:hypothetical protein